MPTVAVVSPFLDKKHGTERITVEWLSHLPPEFQLVVYSQEVADFDPSKFTLRRIPKLSGPHLLNYVWFFAANHLWRAWDRKVGGMKHSLVFSPNINCFDADIISVQIVFAEYVRQARNELRFLKNSPRVWPRLAHRRLYYGLLKWLERRIYASERCRLVLYSHKTAADLHRFYRPAESYAVLHLGIDHATFNPASRVALRDAARLALAIEPCRFVLLLIGNDLIKKGLPTVLQAMSRLPQLPLELIVVSREPENSFRSIMDSNLAGGRVQFLPPRKDVEFYYAAADLYTGPSLEDTFAMPPAEAMACGLPVIVSAKAGVSEIVTHNRDGLILEEPRDAKTLAGMISALYEDLALRERIGAAASETARKYTWQRNGEDLGTVFRETLRAKALGGPMRGLPDPAGEDIVLRRNTGEPRG